MAIGAFEWPPALTGMAVALGIGMLVGLERERRKGQGVQRAAAGLRSFMVASMAGALASAAPWAGLVPATVLAVAALAVISYRRSSAHDPGVTTELALVTTCVIGALALPQPALAAGAGAMLAGLLAARERLHHFATRLLSEAELRDALWLAGIALVLLPLMPAEPVQWLAGLRPRTLMWLVVLILLLQAAGHVAQRLAGPAAGLALSGLFGGLVSSTATIAAMGARARAEPGLRAGCEAGALLSTAATWLQAMVMLAAVAPAAAKAVLPAGLAGMAVAAFSGAWRARAAHRAGDGDRGEPGPASDKGPLRMREAALVAIVLALVALLVSWAQRRFGAAGLLAGTALGAVADAHSSIAALGALSATAQITTAGVVTGTLVAVATNAVTRTATAWMAGGPRYAATVGASLAASTTAAAAVAWAGFA